MLNKEKLDWFAPIGFFFIQKWLEVNPVSKYPGVFIIYTWTLSLSIWSRWAYEFCMIMRHDMNAYCCALLLWFENRLILLRKSFAIIVL